LFASWADCFPAILPMTFQPPPDPDIASGGYGADRVEQFGGRALLEYVARCSDAKHLLQVTIFFMAR